MQIRKYIAALLAVVLLLGSGHADGAERQPVRIAVIDTGISTAAISDENLAEGENYIIPEQDTQDRDGHGTAVASVIVGSESAGIEGICPEAVLVPLVYADYGDDEKKCVADRDLIAQTIRDAVDVYDCDIINFSSVIVIHSPAIEAAVQYAQECGVLVVSASGNGGSSKRYYPGAYEETICVGAVNEEGTGAAEFSNYHKFVDIIAPGTTVSVALPDGTPTILDGTSFATAYISGAAAKLMTEHPDLTAAQVEQILLASARDIAAPGRDNSTGWGVLDMQNALHFAETGQIFRDVAATDWFFREVNEAAEQKILNGTDTVSFAPYQSTTRAMLWVMLYRSEGLPASENAKNWYSDAQEWMISTGISDGSDPNGAITREQMATILWRYAKYKGMNVTAGEEGVLSGYRDSASVSGWAVEAMKWACGVGLINGSDGALLPGNAADRAQTAVILMRFLKI